MKIFKHEMEIILNVLLHYRKYRKLLGKKVNVNTGQKEREIGWVYGFEFDNFKYPIQVRFSDNVVLCYSIKELEEVKNVKRRIRNTI